MAPPKPNTGPFLTSKEAASQFLSQRIDYERTHAMPQQGHELKLDRMRELLDRLGNPQQGLPIIHVAGTKGKGSTAATIAAVLSAAGYRTALFTSPHLDRMEDRMAIDGQGCSGEELAELVAQVRPVVEAMDGLARAAADDGGPTYFEIITAVALLHFARRKADAVVLEVGLGGRLDATNVCQPLVSVITSISFDHVQQLGDTLGSIAREKAGIVKPGVPVVSGVVAEEPRRVIRQVCRERGCRLVELGVNFDFRYHPPRHLEQAPHLGKMDFSFRSGRRHWAVDDLAISLLGHHQAANTAVALATLDELQQASWTIPPAALRAGVSAVAWPARVEVIARRPAIILDGAHNRASIEALMRTLDESFSVARRLLIFAASRDKDLRGMFGCVLGRFDHVALTAYTNNPRAVPAEELQALAFELSARRYPCYNEPAAAWQALRPLATADDLICVTGSFFLAAEMRPLLVGGAVAPLASRGD